MNFVAQAVTVNCSGNSVEVDFDALVRLINGMEPLTFFKVGEINVL